MNNFFKWIFKIRKVCGNFPDIITSWQLCVVISYHKKDTIFAYSTHTLSTVKQYNLIFSLAELNFYLCTHCWLLRLFSTGWKQFHWECFDNTFLNKCWYMKLHMDFSLCNERIMAWPIVNTTISNKLQYFLSFWLWQWDSESNHDIWNNFDGLGPYVTVNFHTMELPIKHGSVFCFLYFVSTYK